MIKSFSCHTFLLSLILLSCVCNNTVQIQNDQFSDKLQPIQPYPENPRYWSYHGKPLLLLGGSKDDNLFQIPGLEAHLDSMQAIGANYVRNTMSSRDPGNLWPYKSRENGQFDLNQWNETYWQKFDNFLRMTHERRIIVQIEVWDRFDYSRDVWQINPINPKNNNLDELVDLLDTVYPLHPYRDVQPFFHTIPDMGKYQSRLDPIRDLQEALVLKMLDYSLNYDHVLYCMNNETSSDPKWGEHWMNLINSVAAQLGKEVFVTDMYDEFYKPQSCEPCRALIAQPETFEFIDCSQINSRNFGQDHWDTLQWIVQQREQHAIRPINCTKVYGGMETTWGSGTNRDGVERFCRDVIGGAAAVRHHRPLHGNGLNNKSIGSIRAFRQLESKVKMWDLVPAIDLLDQREANEAYLSAQTGTSYVVYFPSGGEVMVNIGDLQDGSLQWISIDTGDPQADEILVADSWTKLTAPDTSGWLGLITKVTPSNQ